MVSQSLMSRTMLVHYKVLAKNEIRKEEKA